MIKIILLIICSNAIINSYAQFTDIFWERRLVHDTIGIDTENGIGLETKSGETYIIKLYKDRKNTFTGVIIKDVPQYSDEKLFKRVYDVNVDSSGNYSLDNFINIKYKFLNDRGAFYLDAKIIDENKYSSLFHENYFEGDVATMMFISETGDTTYTNNSWNTYKIIDSSEYSYNVKIPISFYQYDFVKSHPSSYSDPVESSKRTLSYGKFIFKLEEYIYTVYWPLINN